MSSYIRISVEEVVAKKFFDIKHVRFYTGLSRTSVALCPLQKSDQAHSGSSSRNIYDVILKPVDATKALILYMDDNYIKEETSSLAGGGEISTSISAICYTGIMDDVKTPMRQTISGMAMISGIEPCNNSLFKIKIPLWSTADSFLDKNKGAIGDAPQEKFGASNWITIIVQEIYMEPNSHIHSWWISGSNNNTKSGKKPMMRQLDVSTTFAQRKRLHEEINNQFGVACKKLKEEGFSGHPSSADTIVWGCNYLGHLLLGSVDGTFLNDCRYQTLSDGFAAELLFLNAFISMGIDPNSLTGNLNAIESMISALESSTLQNGPALDWISSTISFVGCACPYVSDLRKDPLTGSREMLTVEAIAHTLECDNGDCEDSAWTHMAIFGALKKLLIKAEGKSPEEVVSVISLNSAQSINITYEMFDRLLTTFQKLVTKLELGVLMCAVLQRPRGDETDDKYNGHASCALVNSSDKKIITFIDSIDTFINFYGKDAKELGQSCYEILESFRECLRKTNTFQAMSTFSSSSYQAISHKKEYPIRKSHPMRTDIGYGNRIKPTRLFVDPVGSYVAVSKNQKTIGVEPDDYSVEWRGPYPAASIPPEILLPTTIGIKGKYPVVPLEDHETIIETNDNQGWASHKDKPYVFRAQVNGVSTSLIETMDLMKSQGIISGYSTLKIIKFGDHIRDLTIVLAWT